MQQTRGSPDAYFPLCAVSQTIVWNKFIPNVIRYDRISPIVFEALISGTFSSVAFEYNSIDLPMKDDGTNGDRISGDGIYTITFQASQIIDKITDNTLYRPWIGFCKVYVGTTVAIKYSVLAEIWMESIPAVNLQQLDINSQATPNLVNIVGPVTATNFDARVWAQRFYQLFDDDYDFLNIITTPSSPNNRYHFAVKNSVNGIGLSLFDNSGSYGSSGKLMGITVFPITRFFDGAETAYYHEIAHQWINFLQGTLFQSGIPHWPLSDVASGVMGMSIPGSNVGGSFPYNLIPEGENYRAEFTNDYSPLFNDLELYLIGLLPADSVKSHFVFNDQNQTPQKQANLLYGPVSNISINNLIPIIGERVPNFNNSQKKFRIATIIISDSLLSYTEMSFYDFFANRAGLKMTVESYAGFKSIENPFYVATRGKGEFDPSITLKTVDISSKTMDRTNSFKLNQNYPNPFSISTSINFKIPNNSFVTLKIFSLQGIELEKLVSKKLDAGEYHIEWNPIGLSNGIYFYRLQAGEFVDTKKLLLLR